MMQPSQNIRLVALDLDGTVFDDNKHISPRTLAALTAAARKGVEIVPATGRTATGLPAELTGIPGVNYAITSNGARVVRLSGGPALVELYIPREQAIAAYDVLVHYDCVIDIFQDGQGYTTAENVALMETYVPENLRRYVRDSRVTLSDMREFIDMQNKGLEKYTLFFVDDAERERAWKQMEALGLEVVSSLSHNMELNAKGVSKGRALLKLAEVLGIPQSETMACGDGGNDIAMVSLAGFGVAMANGFDEVKAVADYVTASNNEDGVALALEKFVL